MYLSKSPALRVDSNMNSELGMVGVNVGTLIFNKCITVVQKTKVREVVSVWE